MFSDLCLYELYPELPSQPHLFNSVNDERSAVLFKIASSLISALTEICPSEGQQEALDLPKLYNDDLMSRLQ